MPPFLRQVFEMGDLCQGCNPTYYKVILNCFDKNEANVELFKAHGVLPKELLCHICDHKCTLWESQHIFRCHNGFHVLYHTKRKDVLLDSQYPVLKGLSWRNLT